MEISENKRFKFNEIGLGRFPSLSLSEIELGVLKYYKNENMFMLTSDSIPMYNFQDLEMEEGRNKNKTKKIPVVFFIML